MTVKTFDRTLGTFVNKTLSSGGGAANTDELPEGLANLYFTSARAKSAVGYNTTLNTQTTGTAPIIVGGLKLAARTYSAPAAAIGCGNPANAATLEIRQADGTVLATIGGTAGGLDWRTAPAGFTLAAAEFVDLVLYTDSADAVAFIRGVTIP